MVHIFFLFCKRLSSISRSILSVISMRFFLLPFPSVYSPPLFSSFDPTLFLRLDLFRRWLNYRCSMTHLGLFIIPFIIPALLKLLYRSIYALRNAILYTPPLPFACFCVICFMNFSPLYVSRRYGNFLVEK